MLPDDLGRALIISPHLDDAVFSCAELIGNLPAVTVATVFAGVPGNGKEEMQTEWDLRAGFNSAGEAMLARRQEDSRALDLLGAVPVWLQFLDSQYGVIPAASELVRALATVISESDPETILFPTGLFHSDHVLVHEAALSLLPDYRQKTWFMYEEAMYRRMHFLLQQRLASLCNAGIRLTPRAMPDRPAQEIKRRAVNCYASQLRALDQSYKDGYADIYAPERYWQLENPALLHHSA